MNEDLSELIGKVETDTDRCMVLWAEGPDLHFAWFGMTTGEAVAFLQHTIQNIQGNAPENLGPSPTKH